MSHSSIVSNHPKHIEFNSKWINLAEERLGSKVLFATDDFFAEKENLIKPGRGIFIEDKYTENGKWMDGWESRRKRIPGHDHCIIRLGAHGTIKGFDIDTNHFTGNHPPFACVQAALIENGDPDEDTTWTQILEKSSLESNSQNFFEINDDNRYSHLRLNIYPDGGIARLKVYGLAFVNWDEKKKLDIVDLVDIRNGGMPVSCSDKHYSNPINLIAPERGVNMGDGWETKRRRDDGHDWAILKLGHSGEIKKVEVDTCHFKGNYPDRCSIEGIYLDPSKDQKDMNKLDWQLLLTEQKLKAHNQHYFSELNNIGTITHIRLNIFPDGGVSRLRLLGEIK
jgi:allantoicase